MVCTNSNNNDFCIDKSLLKSINQLDKVYQNDTQFNQVIKFIDKLNNVIKYKDYNHPIFEYVEISINTKLDPKHPDNFEIINKAKLIINKFTSKNNYNYNYNNYSKAYYISNSSNYSINYSTSTNSNRSNNNFPMHINIL